MYYYDRNGEPLELMAWAHLMKNLDYKRVAYTEVGDARVSTVWMGVDHGIFGEGPPLIFETMVFGGKLDQEQWRYSTEVLALAGHDQIVALVADLARAGA